MTVPVGTTRAIVVYAMLPLTVTVPDLNENDAREVVQAWLDGGPKHADWTLGRRTQGGYTTHCDIKIHVPGRAS